MDENSKDAEVRARVPQSTYNELARIAKGRGEQLPVILREALNEYLAKRMAIASGSYAIPGGQELVQSLKDRPDVAATLLAIGRLLSATNSSPGLGGEEAIATEVVERAAALAQDATKPPPPPAKKVSYKAPGKRARKRVAGSA